MSSLGQIPDFWVGTSTRQVAVLPIEAAIGPLTVINVMHWDTQGHELKVAYGAQGLFDQKRVRFVNMEFGPSMMVRICVNHQRPFT